MPPLWPIHGIPPICPSFLGSFVPHSSVVSPFNLRSATYIYICLGYNSFDFIEGDLVAGAVGDRPACECM